MSLIFDRLDRKSFVTASLIASAAMCLVTFIWLKLDHHLPFGDEASHIMDAASYRDLFLRFNPWRWKNWVALIEVNNYYPPIATLGMGICMTIFGKWDEALIFSKIFCLFVASSSVGVIAGRIFKNIEAVVLAVILFNCSTSVIQLSHLALLDMPLIAAISIAMLALIGFARKPSVIAGCLTGLIFGLACMVKQLAVVYLFVPLVLAFLSISRKLGDCQ